MNVIFRNISFINAACSDVLSKHISLFWELLSLYGSLSSLFGW